MTWAETIAACSERTGVDARLLAGSRYCAGPTVDLVHSDLWHAEHGGDPPASILSAEGRIAAAVREILLAAHVVDRAAASLEAEAPLAARILEALPAILLGGAE